MAEPVEARGLGSDEAGVLGPIGALARRADLVGTVARLVVPAGSLAEPFVQGMFTRPHIMPWPDRLASSVCGVALVAAGILAVLRAGRA